MEKLEYIDPVLEIDYLDGLNVLNTVDTSPIKGDENELEPDIP